MSNLHSKPWTPPRLAVQRLSRLNAAEIQRMHDLFRREGAVLINPVSEEELDPPSVLSLLGKDFGAPIFHKLSDERGVHPIRNIAGYASYANTTSAELLLHTDGSFETFSPRVMLMMCEVPAQSGGLSRLCHGADIFAHLLNNHPASIPGLMRPDAFSIRRDDRVALKPVFKREGDRVLVTFRYGGDVDIEVHPEAQAGFQAIVAFLENPGSFCEFLLGRQELLVLDNSRVLHGRTAFPVDEPRILHGLWLDGRSSAGGPAMFGFPVEQGQADCNP